MKYVRNLCITGILVSTFMNFYSCTNEKECYDPNFQTKKALEEYSARFAVKYKGTYTENQNWDLSSNLPIIFLADNALKKAPTRAGEEIIIEKSVDFLRSSGFVSTLRNTLDAMSIGGDGFYFEAPGGDFSITPVYQNLNNNMVLMMCVGTGENATVKRIISNSEGFKGNESSGKGNNSNNGHGNSGGGGNAEVRCVSVRVSGIAPGTPIYFFLDSHKGNKHTKKQSLGGELQLLDITVDGEVGRFIGGATLTDKAFVMGCKQAPSSNGDSNMMAFLLDGLTMNESYTVAPGALNPYIEVVSKRYMIEDLGATGDFDFNDVVVDVRQTSVMSGTSVLHTSQKAIVRHLGGTLPFAIKIGDTNLFGEEMGMPAMNQDPNNEYEITGWIPTENNIEVCVANSENKSDGVKTFGFPKAGTIPMILATETTQEWMEERISVPSSWWTTAEEEGE